jgi:hypothetical protein
MERGSRFLPARENANPSLELPIAPIPRPDWAGEPERPAADFIAAAGCRAVLAMTAPWGYQTRFGVAPDPDRQLSAKRWIDRLGLGDKFVQKLD